MFFGKYLVEKKLITQEQLVSCLCKQFNSLPSLLEVLKNDNKITAAQFLEIVNLHVNSDFELSSLLISKNIINEEELKLAVVSQNSFKKSLSEILIESDLLTNDAMGTYVDNYSSSYEELCKNEGELTISSGTKKVETIAAVKSVPVTETKSEPKVAISAAALESLKELGFSDEEAMAELVGDVATSDEPVKVEAASPVDVEAVKKYLDIFNLKKYKRLVKTLKFIETSLSKKEDPSTYLSSIYRDFYVLKGAASMAGLNEIHILLSSWEGLLEKLFKFDEVSLQTWLKDNLTNLNECIELLWNLRNSAEDEALGNFADEHEKVLAVVDQLILQAA